MLKIEDKLQLKHDLFCFICSAEDLYKKVEFSKAKMQKNVDQFRGNMNAMILSGDLSNESYKKLRHTHSVLQALVYDLSGRLENVSDKLREINYEVEKSREEFGL